MPSPTSASGPRPLRVAPEPEMTSADRSSDVVLVVSTPLSALDLSPESDCRPPDGVPVAKTTQSLHDPSPERRRRVRWGAAALICVAALTVGCSDDEPAVGSFCDELRQAPSLAAVLTGFADQDANQLDGQLDEAEAQYGDLRATAPEEIEPDVERTVDLVDAVIAAVRSESDDPVAAAEAVRTVIADHPDAEISALAVADYARSNCDIELNPGRNADAGSEATVPPAEEDDDGSVTGGM